MPSPRAIEARERSIAAAVSGVPSTSSTGAEDSGRDSARLPQCGQALAKRAKRTPVDTNDAQRTSDHAQLRRPGASRQG